MKGWHDTWNDILHCDGHPRWKVDDLNAKSIALNHIQNQASQVLGSKDSLNIFCPLAGDDPFVRYAWEKGHDVTAIDLVPDAVKAMRSQFEGSWQEEKSDDGTVIWKHESGRVTLYQGDALVQRAELLQKFHAVYDKDSFGALDESMRSDFCKRITDYTNQDGGFIYLEVKNKDEDHPGRNDGPPFHITKDILMDSANFGSSFAHVSCLGKVYEIPIPKMSQIGHILKRLPR